MSPIMQTSRFFLECASKTFLLPNGSSRRLNCSTSSSTHPPSRGVPTRPGPGPGWFCLHRFNRLEVPRDARSLDLLEQCGSGIILTPSAPRSMHDRLFSPPICPVRARWRWKACQPTPRPCISWMSIIRARHLGGLASLSWCANILHLL